MKRLVPVLAALAFFLSLGRASAGLEVQVGYADDIRPSPFFPSPWSGGPGVALFAGGGSPTDSGAVRVINTGSSPVTITGLTVSGFGDGTTFNIWSSSLPFTLNPGLSAIFEQTSGSNNFDSSDHEGGNPSAIPVVNLTTSIGTFHLSDTAQVLNTEGTDHLAQMNENESHQWRDIGTFGGQAGEIPEPASLTVFGLTLGCAAGYGWYRRKRPASA
jgi:hypothetical protein